MSKKIIKSMLLLLIISVSSVFAEQSNSNLIKINPSIARMLPLSDLSYTNKQLLENVNSILVRDYVSNPSILMDNYNMLMLVASSAKIMDIDISRDQERLENLYYIIKANVDDFDPDTQIVKWLINGQEFDGTAPNEIVALLKEGDNSIEADLMDKSNGRNLSTMFKNYNTIVDILPTIVEVKPSVIKYSDDLHYNFYGKYKNMNYAKYEPLWELNGIKLESPGNVLVKEGENKITLYIVDKQSRNIVDQRTKTFNAERAPLHISHVLVVTGEDNSHYNFLSLETSFDPDSQYKEWVLNGKVITNVDNVEVNNGENTITLNIRDKITNNILTTKSKSWNASSSVGISSMEAEEIGGADGFHYRLSAKYVNYDYNRNTVLWLLKETNGNEVSLNPNNAKLNTGLNEIYLYVYDNIDGGLVASGKIKVNVSMEEPEIKNIFAHLDSEDNPLSYTFSAEIENYENCNSSIYILEWYLNGKKIDKIDGVTVLEGQNTLELRVTNSYTNQIIDFQSITFYAVENVSIKNIFAHLDSEDNPFSYTFSAEIENYNPSIYISEWYLNGKKIDKIEGVIVLEGQNTLELRIINRYTNQIVDSQSTTFIVVENVSIKNIFAHLDSEANPFNYTFSAEIENYNPSIYISEWYLNGSKIDKIEGVTVLEGQNTLELRVINSYTNQIVDSQSITFTAVANVKFVLNSYKSTSNHIIFWLDSNEDFRGEDLEYSVDGSCGVITFDANGNPNFLSSSSGVTHYQKGTKVVLEARGCNRGNITANIKVGDNKSSSTIIY